MADQISLSDEQKQALRSAYEAGDTNAFNSILDNARTQQEQAGDGIMDTIGEVATGIAGPVAHGLYNAADSLTAGLAGPAIDKLGGVVTGQTSQQMRQDINDYFDRAHETNPYVDDLASAAGTVGGMLYGAGKFAQLAKLAKEVPALRAFIPVAEDGLAAVAGKSAALGSAVGAASGAANAQVSGRSPSQGAVQGAIGGALAGPVGAVVGSGVARAAEPLGRYIQQFSRQLKGVAPDTGVLAPKFAKENQSMAKALGIGSSDADSLARRAAASDAADAQTGYPQSASAIEVMSPSQRARVSQVAGHGDNSAMFDAAVQARRASQNALPEQVSGAISKNYGALDLPEALEGISYNAATKNQLSNRLNQWANKEFASFRNSEFNIPAGLLNEDEIRAVIRNDRNLKGVRAKLTGASEAVDPKLSGDQQKEAFDATPIDLTGGEIDTIRKVLNKKSQHSGDVFAEARQDLLNEVASQSPEYQKILTKYGNGARFIQGFEQGVAGRVVGDVGATNKAFSALGAPGENSLGKQGLGLGLAKSAEAEALKGPGPAGRVAGNLVSSSNVGRGTRAAMPAGAGDRLKQQLTTAFERDLAGAQALPSGLGAASDDGLMDAVRSFASGAGQVAVGMPNAGTANVARGFARLLKKAKFSPEYQQIIMASLTSRDPVRRDATIAALRAAGLPDLALAGAHAFGAVTAGGEAGELLK